MERIRKKGGGEGEAEPLAISPAFFAILPLSLFSPCFSLRVPGSLSLIYTPSFPSSLPLPLSRSLHTSLIFSFAPFLLPEGEQGKPGGGGGGVYEEVVGDVFCFISLSCTRGFWEDKKATKKFQGIRSNRAHGGERVFFYLYPLEIHTVLDLKVSKHILVVLSSAGSWAQTVTEV